MKRLEHCGAVYDAVRLLQSFEQPVGQGDSGSRRGGGESVTNDVSDMTGEDIRDVIVFDIHEQGLQFYVAAQTLAK
jgi:hypothetical protein